MKATGEVMAIDRTFGSALNKALRGLEQAGVGPLAEDPSWTPDVRLPRRRSTPATRRPTSRSAGSTSAARPASRPATPSAPPRPIVLRRFLEPSDSRLWRLLGLLRRGVPGGGRRRGDRDRGLVPRRDGPQRRARGARSRRSGARLADPADAEAAELLATVKRAGFGDRELAGLAGTTPDELRAARLALGLVPGLRDGRHLRRRVRGRDAVLLLDLRRGRLARRRRRRSTRPAALVIGSGPVRIGQGIEFDYCAVQAADTLRRAGLAGGDDQLEPGDRLDRLRRLVAAVLRAARPGERAQRHRRRDARRRRRSLPARRRVRRPDAAQPRRAARRRRRPAARHRTSRRSTRPRSGPASRRCSTGSASRSRRAAWPTASRRR